MKETKTKKREFTDIRHYRTINNYDHIKKRENRNILLQLARLMDIKIEEGSERQFWTSVNDGKERSQMN